MVSGFDDRRCGPVHGGARPACELSYSSIAQETLVAVLRELPMVLCFVLISGASEFGN